MKKVYATFQGVNKSLGFEKDKEYHIRIVNLKDRDIISVSTDSGLYCEYSSIISFLNNWDNIKSRPTLKDVEIKSFTLPRELF